MSVAIIINPISGGARLGAAQARAQLARDTVDHLRAAADVSVTDGPGHARALADAAVKRGARLIIAWGGDGTINEIASAVAFTGTSLGIIPAGSGNGLARELGVDRRPAHAIAAALAAAPRAIDLGEIEGRLFVNIAGIGVDAHVAALFNMPANRRRGFRTYVSVTFGVLARYVPVSYRITTGDRRIETRAVLVTLANSAQFGNGARIAPGALVDDGLLDLVVVEERSRFRTLCQVPRLFNGTVARMPGYTVRPIRDVTIEADQPMTFHADGEPVDAGTTLRARVHPGALRVSI